MRPFLDSKASTASLGELIALSLILVITEPFASPYISRRPSGNTSAIFTPELTPNFFISAGVKLANLAPKNSDFADSEELSPFTISVLPSLFFNVTLNSFVAPSRLTVT